MRRSVPQTFPPAFIGSTETPVGRLWIAIGERGILAVDWEESASAFCAYIRKRFGRVCVEDASKIAEVARQLQEYFHRERRSFDLPIDWSTMRPFQQQVLQATLTIPYGSTRTYLDLARQIGHPRATRAVGRAEARNPIPIIIPCHRVIGSDGKMHGYGGGEGSKTKVFLLELEGVLIPSAISYKK